MNIKELNQDELVEKYRRYLIKVIILNWIYQTIKEYRKNMKDWNYNMFNDFEQKADDLEFLEKLYTTIRTNVAPAKGLLEAMKNILSECNGENRSLYNKIKKNLTVPVIDFWNKEGTEKINIIERNIDIEDHFYENLKTSLLWIFINLPARLVWEENMPYLKKEVNNKSFIANLETCNNLRKSIDKGLDPSFTLVKKIIKVLAYLEENHNTIFFEIMNKGVGELIIENTKEIKFDSVTFYYFIKDIINKPELIDLSTK